MIVLAMRTHIPVSAWLAEPAHILETAVEMMLEQIEAEQEQNREVRKRGR